MKLLPTNQWSQPNNGSIFGVLHESHNMNFDRLGEARLGKKAIALMDSTTDSDFGLPLAIVYFNGGYHFVTADSLFRGTLSGTSFTEVDSTPQLSENTDALVFNSKLYVTRDTSLSSLDTSGTWANSLDTYTSGYPHPMAEFASMTTYKLAVGNVNQVETLDTSHNANGTVLTIPSNYVITSLAYRSGYLYIATKEIYGGEACIFMWNGSGTSAQYSIPVGAGWVYSIVPFKGTIAGVTNEGELFYISGNSKEQLAVFPVFHYQGARWEQGDATLGKVYPRGMAVLGDTIYISVSGEVEVGDCREMRSGLWCYNPNVGLYHYASPSTDLWVKDSLFSVSSSVITTSATHNIKLGDTVVFTGIDTLTNISADTLYYAIPVTTTTLKIAGSRKDAFLGNNVVIGGTKGTENLHYAGNVDSGHSGEGASGPVAVTNYLDDSLKLFTSDVLWGATIPNNTDDSTKVICTLTQAFNYGSFTTQRIYTSEIKQSWNALHAFVTGILYDGEKAIVKYLDREIEATRPVSITWTASDVFVTTDRSYARLIEEGDEVEFVSGNGQGKYAHITNISYSDTTIQIMVDEEWGTTSETGKVKFTGFKKLQEITATREDLNTFSVGAFTKRDWVQFKGEMRGYEAATSQLTLIEKVDKRAV